MAKAGGGGVFFRLRRATLRLRLAYAGSRLGRARFSAPRFLFVPPYLDQADPTIAGDILAGQMVLAGRSLLTSAKTPFDFKPPSLAFARALHGFHWLAHFDASDRASVRAHAQKLAQAWMLLRETGRLPPLEHPSTLARRLISWLTHSSLLTENADHSHYRRVLRHIAQDAATLSLLVGRRDIGMADLEAAIALHVHALCLSAAPRAIRSSEARLEAALRRCIAADGSPRDRNGASATRIVADLVPVLALYRARQLSAPAFLSEYLARLVAFVRMLQHADGGLAHFNGAGLAPRDLVAEVSQFGVGRAPRIDLAANAGLVRLENQHGLLIADFGASIAPAFANWAGASALSFEFATRLHKIIVNCGQPAWLPPESEVAGIYRAAPAHSTWLIDDNALGRIEQKPALFGPEARLLRARPGAVPPIRQQEPDGERLVLRHEGLKEELGLVIERELCLLAAGGLAGIDRLLQTGASAAERQVSIAFHLHPHLRAIQAPDLDAILLALPQTAGDEPLWRFECPGFSLHLEESRCFERDIVNPASQQIVLTASMQGGGEIHWFLRPLPAEAGRAAADRFAATP